LINSEAREGAQPKALSGGTVFDAMYGGLRFWLGGGLTSPTGRPSRDRWIQPPRLGQRMGAWSVSVPGFSLHHACLVSGPL